MLAGLPRDDDTELQRQSSLAYPHKESKMKNTKTTIAGFLTLGAAVLSVVAAVLGGGDIGSVLTQVLVPALTGIGLIGASDGGL